MKPLYMLVLTAFLPLAAFAQTTTETVEAPPMVGASPIVAADVHPDELIWLKRPVVVFADSPFDPSFTRQMDFLAADRGELAERDVVIVTDTDPKTLSEWRRKLRPRGFSLVLMDKDGEAKLRKPLPWDLREIIRSIDKFPLVRQEALERHPSGR